MVTSAQYQERDEQKAPEIRVLFALPVVGHPRDSKRIAMLQKAGFAVEAIAFEREFHKGRMPTCPFTIVGKVEHGRYLKRLVTMLRALPAIRQKLRGIQLVYASGVDMALLCLLAAWGLDQPIVLEIGDVREIQTARSTKGLIARRVDRWIADRCCLLVATAEDFIDVYYRQWVGTNTPAMIIENKLDVTPNREGSFPRSTVDFQVAPSHGRPLRIGYFGVLRWLDSWETLRSLAESWPDEFAIVVAGHVLEPLDLADQVKRYRNVQYLGEFRWPDDLPELYGGVDLIWAVRPEIRPDDWNHRWARTNRFYEGCYFRTPIISRAGCKDAEEVRRHNIGLIVGSSDVATIAEQLRGVTPEKLSEWKSNMARLPRNVSVYTDEAETLGNLLRNILQSPSQREGA